MTWADDTDRAIDKLLTREIEEVFKRTPFLVTNTLVRTLRNFSTLYSFRVADKLEPYKDQILASIENDILNHPDYMYGTINEIEELQAVGVHWPELLALLELHKPHIMKVLLTKYRAFYKKRDILPFLETLRNIGVAWPEFAAIEKSANAELIESINSVKSVTPQERYVIDKLFPGSYYVAILSLYTWPTPSDAIRAALEKQKPRLLAYLTESIMKNNFSTFFKAVRGLITQQIAWPELDDLVQVSKRPFIVKLLTKLKNHEDSTDLIYIETVIKDARRVVNWPELSVIRDHAAAELDLARDQGMPGYEPDSFDDELRGQ